MGIQLSDFSDMLTRICSIVKPMCAANSCHPLYIFPVAVELSSRHSFCSTALPICSNKYAAWMRDDSFWRFKMIVSKLGGPATSFLSFSSSGSAFLKLYQSHCNNTEAYTSTILFACDNKISCYRFANITL